ncbi:hypothetical protein [Bradyrhizobium betae]|uniref:hypothetical protein n=1 Tax=Bradyrhizobium betae TaxID=244734 RepID=UPI00100FA7EB|nr:hypothetical protein [Bradyrhizobium betae]
MTEVDRTTAYFDDVVARSGVARGGLLEPADGARKNDCHDNCAEFARQHPDHEIVRGWLVIGGHWLVPHSVVRHTPTGKLKDITPRTADAEGIPFVEHRGSEEDFATLRVGRDGGWLHPPVNAML